MTPPHIGTAADLTAFVAGQPRIVAWLRALDALGLPDAGIGAGVIRNPVWDALHGRAPDFDALSDVDVLFFDPADPSRERESAVEAALSAAHPGVPWSARNQARMHLRNDDAPYRDTGDALFHWLETATAVAARLRDGRVELLAPCGPDDLLGLVLRPTPPTAARSRKMAEYRERVRSKGWLARWPRLTAFGLEAEAS